MAALYLEATANDFIRCVDSGTKFEVTYSGEVGIGGAAISTIALLVSSASSGTLFRGSYSGTKFEVATDGYVGLGTGVNSNYNLVVSSANDFRYDTVDGLNVNNATSGQGTIAAKALTGKGALYLESSANSFIACANGGIKFEVDSAGNVGLGGITGSVAYSLTIGSAGSTGRLVFDGLAAAGNQFPSAGDLCGADAYLTLDSATMALMYCNGTVWTILGV